MNGLNMHNEWRFIQNEIHKAEPSAKNRLKRELLFTLHLLLPNLSSKNEVNDYKKTKEVYLRLGN
jgi:hypothetical protein